MPTDQQGAIETIASVEDVPLKMLEAILEGIQREPTRFVCMGLGFYLGWKGLDVMNQLMGPFKGIADAIAKGPGQLWPGGPKIQDSLEDIADIPLMISGPLTGILNLIKNEKPNTDTHSEMETVADIKADSSLSDEEKRIRIWWHDVEARLLMGCMGALTAAVITSPGFLVGVGSIVQGVGEIAKGVGETVPL